MTAQNLGDQKKPNNNNNKKKTQKSNWGYKTNVKVTKI